MLHLQKPFILYLAHRVHSRPLFRMAVCVCLCVVFAPFSLQITYRSPSSYENVCRCSCMLICQGTQQQQREKKQHADEKREYLPKR